MSKSIAVSLKREELVELRDLYVVEWGRNTDTASKLERAIGRIDAREAEENE